MRTYFQALLAAAVALGALAAGPPVAAASTGPEDPAAVAGDLSRPLAERMDAQLRLGRDGVRISRNQVAYLGGQAIVTLPETSTGLKSADSTLAATGCPTEIFGNDWYCFYEHANYGGRRLQWNATHCGVLMSFADAGMDNAVSSWDNGGGLTIRVYDTSRGGSWLWTERPHTERAYVGSALNDRASFFTACAS